MGKKAKQRYGNIKTGKKGKKGDKHSKIKKGEAGKKRKVNQQISPAQDARKIQNTKIQYKKKH